MTKEELQKRKKRAAIVARELEKLFPEMYTMLHHRNPWELLVAVILSAQTTDKHVNTVTPALFKKYPKIEDYADASVNALAQDIKSVNYFNSKAGYIVASANRVLEVFDGEVPKTMEDMVTLKGVGRKTANVVLGNAYDVVEGIAVDTHVRRLSRLFGLTDYDDPVKIERDLMDILPKEEWFPWTYRMIEYGRKYCSARKKKHEDCPVYQKLVDKNVI